MYYRKYTKVLVREPQNLNSVPVSAMQYNNYILIIKIICIYIC